MGEHLNWLIVRNNHAFLRKKMNVKKPFSCEPGNLRNVNCLAASGFLKQKTVDITPGPQGKGIVLTMKKGKYKSKPAKNYLKTTIKSGPKKTLATIRRIFKYNRYRMDMMKVALRRAAIIQQSQKPVTFKSKRRSRGTNKKGKAGKATAKKT